MREVQLTGEPKSGTTWMEYVLIQLCMSACSMQTCTCTWHSRKAKANANEKMGHRLLEWLGLQKRGADLRRSYLLASPSHTAHDTPLQRNRSSVLHSPVIFSQAKHSKHSVPGVLGSRFPRGIGNCARTLNVTCLQQLASPVQPWNARTPEHVHPLLVLRDPRHLVLSECAWRLRMSYHNCLQDSLRERAQNVASRFALHTALFQKNKTRSNSSGEAKPSPERVSPLTSLTRSMKRGSGLIVYYNDLISSFQHELKRICAFAGFCDTVCDNATLLSNIEQQTSKESMRELEQSRSGSIPGPNRAGISQKVSSSKPVGTIHIVHVYFDWITLHLYDGVKLTNLLHNVMLYSDRLSQLSEAEQRFATCILREELPEPLLKKLEVDQSITCTKNATR